MVVIVIWKEKSTKFWNLIGTIPLTLKQVPPPWKDCPSINATSTLKPWNWISTGGAY